MYTVLQLDTGTDTLPKHLITELKFLTICFIKVDIDPLKLKVHVPLIGSHCIDTMFITDNLPEL